MAFEQFAQVSKRRRAERAEELKKKILVAVFLGVFLLLCVAGGVFAFLQFKGDNDKTRNHDNSKGSSTSSNSKPLGASNEGNDHAIKTSSKIVQMLCEPTDYKKTCEEALTKLVNDTNSSPAIEPRVIVKTAISAAVDAVVKAADETGAFKFDKPEEKAAYDVCKKLFEVWLLNFGTTLCMTSRKYMGTAKDKDDSVICI